MSCDVSLQQDLIDKIQDDVYTVCNPLPTLVLTANDLAIIESGSWCGYQPTYAPVNYPAVTTVASIVKSTVYNEMMSEFNGIKAGIEGSMALNYSSKLERNSDAEALAAKIDISYSQLNTAMYAQATSFQSALTNTAYALSEQISTTEANMLGGFNAATTFYQSSLATLSDAYAEAGLLVTATNATGGKVISGFKATADTEESEFVIFADRFKVVNALNEEAYAPFTVQNGTVYIGEVDTSQPQITYLGEYSSAPVTTKINAVYKNSVNGNSYVWNGSSWILWLTKGTDGLPGPAGATGASGTRGSVHITVNGTYSGGSATSSAFSSATALYDKVIGDWVTFNSGSGATDYYRSGNGSDSWVNAALYVNGNMLVTGTVYSSALNTDAITACRIYVSDNNSAAYATFRSYFTTYNSTVAIGGVHSASSYFGAGVYGRTDSSVSGSSGVNGVAQAYGTYGVLGTSDSGAGVYGVSYASGVGVYGASSSGVGLNGHSGAWAVAGNTSDVNGQWGLITYDKAYIGGSSYPFTGAHIAYSLDPTLVVGDIVSIEKTHAITVDQTYSIVYVTSVAKDKRVAGVVAYSKSTGILDNFLLCRQACTTEDIIETSVIQETGEEVETKVDTLFVPKQEYAEYADILVNGGYVEVGVNAVGEGMINVCSEGGDIEIGDYLCSSSILGKSMKQDDDLLHNYTVAKATQYVVWANEPSNIKMIGCTYHSS